MMIDDPVYKIQRVRWFCSYCKASRWWSPSTHIGRPPIEEHDRPWGGRCFCNNRRVQTCASKGNAGKREARMNNESKLGYDVEQLRATIASQVAEIERLRAVAMPKVEAKRKPDDPRGVCGCPHDWLRTNKDGSSVCGDCGEPLPPVTPQPAAGRRTEGRCKMSEASRMECMDLCLALSNDPNDLEASEIISAARADYAAIEARHAGEICSLERSYITASGAKDQTIDAQAETIKELRAENAKLRAELNASEERLHSSELEAMTGWNLFEEANKKIKGMVCGKCFNSHKNHIWDSSLIPDGGWVPCPVCQPKKEE